MRFSALIGLAAAAFQTVSAAACTSNLLIDNFAKWSTNTNSLASWTSGMSQL
jgi:hypothetical protein